MKYAKECKLAFVCYDNSSSFFKLLKKDIILTNYYSNFFSKNSFFRKIIRKILSYSNFSFVYKILYGEWYNLYKNGGYNIIFFDECGITNNIVFLINAHPNRFLIYFYNTFSKCAAQKKLTKLICAKYSFDYEDCKKYKFKYHQFLYPKIDCYENEKNEILYDLFFLGQNKGRGIFLNGIKNNVKNYKLYFEIIDNPKKFWPYDKYVQYLKKANCIVEIVQKGQGGETFRTIESTTFRKKLITNNVNVFKSELYSPNNVLFFENPNEITDEILKDFLSKPYDESLNKFKNKYYYDGWVEGVIFDENK